MYSTPLVPRGPRGARQSVTAAAGGGALGRHPGRPAPRGFTLIEMIVATTIVAILMSIGLPSYRYITNANRISGEVNGLLGDMQFARAEAIKEGQTVTVCSSNDGASCSNSTSWARGWIVFNDPNNNHVVDAGPPPEVVMRLQRSFGGTDTFVANNNLKWVTFNRDGFALNVGAAVVITLHDALATRAYTRCLAMTIVGQLQVVPYNGGNCT